MSARTCPSCGSPLSATARFCVVCGTRAADPPAVEQPLPGRPVSVVTASPVVAGAVTYVPPDWVAIPVPKTPPSATVALAFGITTWALLLFFIGIFTGFFTAPVAVAAGAYARRLIDAEPERLTGRGKATAGLWLGLSYLLLTTAIVTLMVAARLF